MREKIFIYTITVLFGLSALFFGIAKVAPIQVLKDWHISVPDKTYHPGDTVVVDSHSYKLRKAAGEATRTIECNARADSVIGYALNKVPALRTPGYKDVETDIILPPEITDLPATCRIVITVKYSTFFGLRTIEEDNVSNDFTISVQ